MEPERTKYDFIEAVAALDALRRASSAALVVGRLLAIGFRRVRAGHPITGQNIQQTGWADISEPLAMPKPTVFITYTPAERSWKDRIAHHLSSHKLAVWDDRHHGWDSDGLAQLEEAMEAAQVAVLLLSQDFIASPLVLEVEIPFLFERRRTGDLEILPVLVNGCEWREIGWPDGLPVITLDGEPLDSGDEPQVDEVLRALALTVADRLQKRSPEDSAPLPDLESQVSRERLFRQLFEEFYRPVFYFFSRRGLDREECRDLTQETFSNAYKGMGAYRNEASYKTWLLKIAKHLWLNRQRGLQAAKRNRPEVSRDEERHNQPVKEPADDAVPNPEKKLLQEERVRLVRSVLADLPRQRRRCLLLRLEDLKYREIADLLGISIQGVRSHLFQARLQLRELLDEHFSEDDF